MERDIEERAGKGKRREAGRGYSGGEGNNTGGGSNRRKERPGVSSR